MHYMDVGSRYEEDCEDEEEEEEEEKKRDEEAVEEDDEEEQQLVVQSLALSKEQHEELAAEAGVSTTVWMEIYAAPLPMQ